MLRGVRYERGSLSFETDYVRGRLMKANVTIRPDGSFSLDNQQPRGGCDAMDPPAAGQEDSGFGHVAACSGRHNHNHQAEGGIANDAE